MDNHSNTSNNGDDASNGVDVPNPGPHVTTSSQSIRLFGRTISVTMPVSNGHDLHPSNPAPTLPQQEVAVNEAIEDVNAPITESEEELLEFNDEEELLGNAIVHRPGRRLIYYGVSLEGVSAFQDIMARRLVTRALTPTQIGESLNISSYNGTLENQEACSICLEDFRHGEDVASLQCHHIFHTACITQWFNRSNRCPNCNAEAHDLGW